MNDSFGNSWLPTAISLLGAETPAECLDNNRSVYERMLSIMPVLGGKGEMWKIFFEKEESSWKMNETYSGFENWNSDQSEKILEWKEYWEDFRSCTAKIIRPVLFYYGEKDRAIGPEHYKGIEFPNILLWGSDTGHMPFLESKDDLLHAIQSYKKKVL